MKNSNWNLTSVDKINYTRLLGKPTIDRNLPDELYMSLVRKDKLKNYQGSTSDINSNSASVKRQIKSTSGQYRMDLNFHSLVE